MRIDFEVSRHGTADERLPADAIRSGSAFAIDQRYIGVIIRGAIQYGQVVR
jgi:hypothetical protein